MPKAAPPVFSPTVATVFDNFLKALKEEKVIDDLNINALRAALEEQRLDIDDLRSALFGAQSK